MKNVRVLVIGSPGAGKTSILNGLGDKSGFDIVTLGTLMQKYAAQTKQLEDRDRLRYIKITETDEIRNKALGEIKAMKANVIIDTHATVERKGRFIAGLPLKALESIGNLAGIIYIDATTEEIIQRRERDAGKRNREIEKPDVLDAQRIINLSMLAFYNLYLNIPIYSLHNEEGQLERSIERLKYYLEDILNEATQ